MGTAGRGDTRLAPPLPLRRWPATVHQPACVCAPPVHIWKTALTARFLPQKPPVTTLDIPAQLWLITSRIRLSPARAPARTPPAPPRAALDRPHPRRTRAPSAAACGWKRALARAARRWRGICRRGDDTGLEIVRTAAHSSFLVPSCKETRISPALPVWGSTPSRLSHSPPGPIIPPSPQPPRLAPLIASYSPIHSPRTTSAPRSRTRARKETQRQQTPDPHSPRN